MLVLDCPDVLYREKVGLELRTIMDLVRTYAYAAGDNRLIGISGDVLGDKRVNIKG